MSISQIKGYRIANGQITPDHLSSDFKLKENQLNLNYPTHDNSGDLTVEEKNTLTAMGNADKLHYHLGGGGGVQGIYTNEERDVQLLKLSMLVNSTKYGMDKSVKDMFKDDSSIYYGVKTAIAPNLVLHNADAEYPGVLNPNSDYSYALVYKTLYGKTNVINASSITTGGGTVNAVTIEAADVPPSNLGLEIYRCDGNVEKVIVDNENLSEWDNPFNLPISLDSSRKTSGLSSTKISLKGFGNGSSAQYVSTNLALNVGKTVLSTSTQLNTVITKNPPINYYIQINNRGNSNRIDLIWDKNPANIPLNYELYYTTEYVGSTTEVSVDWYPFNKLTKMKNMYNVPLSVSTDGTISEDFTSITGNSKFSNIFLFETVQNISAIKIVVNKVPQNCNLIDLRLWTEENSSMKFITHDFKTGQNFSNYNTLKVDVKSNGNHRNVALNLLDSQDTVTNPVTEYNAGTASTITNFTGQTVRMRVGDNTTRNRLGYDRIRFSIRPLPNQNLRIENCFITLDTRGHDHNINLADANSSQVVIPITFNNGFNYYEGIPTGPIWCDWAYAPFPNQTIGAYVVTFSVVTGSLLYIGYEWAETYYTSQGQGMEAVGTWNGATPTVINPLYNYSYIEQLQIGQSNESSLVLDNFNQAALERWHRHYVPMPGGTYAQNVQKLIVNFNNLVTDQDVLIDNISLSRTNDVVTEASTTIAASKGCLNPANVKNTDNSYFQSDLPPTLSAPKIIMFDFGNPISINKLLMYSGFLDNTPSNYSIQAAVNNNANVDDAYSSPNWITIKSVSIGEPGIPLEFTGTISDGIIYNQNTWDTHVCHKFDPITTPRIRIVIFQTINAGVVKISNIRIFTAEDLGDFKKIIDVSKPITDHQIFVDDGKPYTEDSPQQFNTTGSFNIYYDSINCLIKLIDTSQNGVLYLNEISLQLFVTIVLSAQTVGDVSFYGSIDGGSSFEPIIVDTMHTFLKQSKSLILKAVFASSDAALSALAFLYTL